MKPRVPLRTADGYPVDYEPSRGGAGFVLIGAFLIGLCLYVIALVTQ